jgi:hypothetical protein
MTGEESCEGKGYDKEQCLAVGCCEYGGDNECHSAVGARLCGGASTEGIVLPTYGKGAWKPVWKDGAGFWKNCAKTTSVFGVVICLTADSAKNEAKSDHIAGVLGQLLDNNADGKANDEKVVKYMVANKMYMFVKNTEDDSADPPEGAKGQETGIYEAFPNSCDTPTNRGATTDRSTWAAAVGNAPGSTGCDTNRDATTEETLHLITEAAAKVFPAKWKAAKTSEAGAAAFAANGNCGWGYTSDYKNPGGSSPACTGQYAYNDKTCNEACVVVEGIYWASVSWMGGLMTNQRANTCKEEWLMTVPDASMKSVLPAGQTNAKTLEEGSAKLYGLVSDTTSDGHKWLPSIMPNGKYEVTDSNAKASSGSGLDGAASAITTSGLASLLLLAALAHQYTSLE